jgi:hypothetical protein
VWWPLRQRRPVVAFVGTRLHGLGGKGKLQPKVYIPALRRAGAAHGIDVAAFRSADHFWRKHRRYRGGTIVPVFNEDKNFGEVRPEIEAIESMARSEEGWRVIHGSETASILSDKSRTNAVLCPKLLLPPVVDSGTIFSNARSGTQADVVVAEGTQGLEGRYNTRFIDTRHGYAGRLFHISLRALTVGGELVVILVRARPGEECPSVHTQDTPLDAGMISCFHARVAEPRRAEIEAICRRVHAVIGMGFYSIDLLPEAASGRLFVSEVGFKFHDATFRNHFLPLRAKLPMYESVFSQDYLDLSADAFFRGLAREGMLDA